MTEKAKAIHATDLRIGNKINDLFGGMCEVRGITRRGIYIRDSSGPANESAFSGIPLTPEILLKCGFENRFGCTYFKDRLKFTYENNELSQFVRFHYSGKVVYIQYLHQLQNLYHSLTNKELEIKL